MNKVPLTKRDWWKIAKPWILFIFIMTVVVGALLGPICPPDCGTKVQRTAAMQVSRQIGTALFLYAQDHNGKYPDGASSTEIFQQLLDGNYVTDPELFFLHLPGKVHPHDSKLKPENVGWDVTCCVDEKSPDNLPLVFITGYHVSYKANTAAMLERSFPPRTWAEWWGSKPELKPYMAVYYKGNNAVAMKTEDDGSVPNFIPADFDPKGKTYRQLTP